MKYLLVLLFLVLVSCGRNETKKFKTMYDPKHSNEGRSREIYIRIHSIVGNDTLFYYDFGQYEKFYSTENLSRFFNEKQK